MSNKNLRIGAAAAPPFIVKSTDKNGKDSFSGIIWDFMEYIQKARNCTFTVVTVTPQDNLWGNCFGDNNCTGMIGMVSRKEVDFALGLLGFYFLGVNKLSSHLFLNSRTFFSNSRSCKCCGFHYSGYK